MVDKCDWCGRSIPRTGPSQHTTGIRKGYGFLKVGRLYCSNKCANEGEASRPSEDNQQSSKVGGFISNQFKTDEEKLAEKGLTAEQISVIKNEEARLEMEKKKLADEKEEREAARRKERADELRKQGKHKLAFWVEMNPIYIIGGLVVIGILLFFAYDKYEKYSDRKEQQEWVDELLEEGETKNNKQAVATIQEQATDIKPETNDNTQEVETQKADKFNQTDEITDSPDEEEYNPFRASIIPDKSYFYDAADINTKRKGYLIKEQYVQINSEDGLFYNITYTSENGKKTTAWMLKSELRKG